MKKTLGLLLILALVASPALAQDPPTGLQADHDGNGTVDLTWVAPFAADYEDDFEDGEAQGWIYDVDANWAVENGALAGMITPVAVQWTGAAYATETYGDLTAEVEVTRTAGTASFSQGLFVRASGPYGDVTGYSGYMVNIAPADFGGAFLIVKYVNDVATFITPSWVNADMNIGVGATNVMTVTASGSTFTLFVNGTELFTWEDTSIADGHVGVGFAEDLSIFGRVEWDHVAVDDFAAAVASMPAQPSVDLPVVDDSYILQAPARLGRVAEHKVQPNGILYQDGVYQGQVNNELDEFIEWRVYRDGNQIGTATDVMYTDMLDDFGTYEYTVTGFYDEGESDAAGPVTVVYTDPNLYPINEDFDDGLPDTWMVEGQSATLNWHVDNGDERGLFDTPYMLIDSDAPGSCPNVYGRLITPMTELNNPTTAVFEYDFVFDEYVDEFGYVDWSVDGGSTWNNLVTYEEVDLEGTDVQHDVTDALMGEDQVWFSFMYDDDFNWGWYFAVDNVEFYVDQDGGDDPATLTLTPVVDTVPAAGGDVVFDAALMTTLNQGYPNVQFWLEVEAPNGNMYGPLNTMTFNLPPMADLAATGATLTVPGFAGAGEYDLMGYVGYPTLNISDGFMFTKEGAAAMGSMDAGDFDANVPAFIAADEPVKSSLPSEYALEQAYPNPFNPTTTVAVALPSASELTVTVYNVAGQQVAELANGQHEAGRHALTFDASHLSSGIYFVQAVVPGQLNQTQKVMLVQ